MSWNVEIQIDATKGDDDGNRYRIHLWGYYPNDNTPGRKKGECIGAIVRTTRILSSIENLKAEAEDLWKEWISRYPGSMIKIWANDINHDNGSKDSLFYSDNFKYFKDGTKHSEGTPF